MIYNEGSALKLPPGTAVPGPRFLFRQDFIAQQFHSQNFTAEQFLSHFCLTDIACAMIYNEGSALKLPLGTAVPGPRYDLRSNIIRQNFIAKRFHCASNFFLISALYAESLPIHSRGGF